MFFFVHYYFRFFPSTLNNRKFLMPASWLNWKRIQTTNHSLVSTLLWLELKEWSRPKFSRERIYPWQKITFKPFKLMAIWEWVCFWTDLYRDNRFHIKMWMHLWRSLALLMFFYSDAHLKITKCDLIQCSCSVFLTQHNATPSVKWERKKWWEIARKYFSYFNGIWHEWMLFYLLYAVYFNAFSPRYLFLVWIVNCIFGVVRVSRPLI